MKKFYSLVAALSMTTALSANAGSLDETLMQAYTFNPDLHSSREEIKARDELMPQALSGFLPQARFDYTVGAEREKINNGTRNSFNPQTREFSITQPIFQGGETLARISRAENQIDAGRYGLQEAEQRLLQSAVQAYMSVVRNQEVLRLSKHNEEVLGQQLSATKDRFELGETTRTDVAQSEARLSRAMSDRLRAEGDLDSAKATFIRIVGQPVENATMPTDVHPVPDTLEEAIAIGTKENPNLLASQYVAKSAKDDVDIAVARILPDVNVRASKRTVEDGGTFVGDQDSDSVLLQVAVPLFQGGAEYSAVRQNKRVAEQRKLEQENAYNETVERITRAWEDLQTARATIKANADAVKAAAVALDGVKQENEVGSRTTLDVLDAEQELFVARVNLITAQTNEVIAIYNLRASIGYLTMEKLKLPVEIYNPKDHYQRVKYRFVGL